MPPIIARGSLGGRAVHCCDAAGFIFTETRHRPDLSLPSHANDRATMIAVLRGDYVETIAGRTRACAPGSLIVRPPGEVHSNRIGRRGAGCLLIELTPDRLAAIREHDDLFDRPRVITSGMASPPALRATREIARPDAASPLLLEAMALEIVAQAIRRPLRAARLRRPWLDQVRHELEPVEGEASPTLAGLAGMVGRHPVYLARAFRAAFGCSVGEYARRRRIAWSCEQLSGSDLTLAAIATGAGFHDQSHLSRVFRRHTGWSPAAYRRAAREGSADTAQVRHVLDAPGPARDSGDDSHDA